MILLNILSVVWNEKATSGHISLVTLSATYYICECGVVVFGVVWWRGMVWCGVWCGGYTCVFHIMGVSHALHFLFGGVCQEAALLEIRDCAVCSKGASVL